MGDDDQPLLNGIVEVDETYIGGKPRDVGRGYTGNKAVVVGAVERGGEVRLKARWLSGSRAVPEMACEAISPGS